MSHASWVRRFAVSAILALAVSMGVTHSASAMVVLYSANFNAPTYTDGVLVSPTSATDSTTVGQDGWINTSGNTNLIAVSNSATNGFVTMTSSGQDVRHTFAPVNSGSVYFDADIKVTAAQATGDYALHFGDGGASNFNARTYIKASGAGFVMAEGTGSGTLVTYGSTVLNFNQTYHVLVRYDINAGTTNDSGAIYIDPTTEDGTGDTPYVNATLVGTDATSISAIYMRQGGATAAASLTVDNFRAFVEPVPEPTSMALLGFAGIGLGSRLLRRKETK
ncbi:MAG: PEP-CTERM sorting domain-containing protein [Gemmataceae bacterium]